MDSFLVERSNPTGGKRGLPPSSPAAEGLCSHRRRVALGGAADRPTRSPVAVIGRAGPQLLSRGGVDGVRFDYRIGSGSRAGEIVTLAVAMHENERAAAMSRRVRAPV